MTLESIKLPGSFISFFPNDDDNGDDDDNDDDDYGWLSHKNDIVFRKFVRKKYIEHVYLVAVLTPCWPWY